MTGFTPASVATGLAGTASTFMADIRRDGFQMGDIGNLGMGLLFDAASIVPVLGVGASTGKVMKALKKGLPVLMKLAGIAGIGSSLSLAVNKIQSGEELTMKDLRIIMNGVLGTYTMAKQGIDVTNSRKKNGAKVDVDLKKMHMDQIDNSNLSEGQKAALKQYFDPDNATPGAANKYRDALTDQAQKDIFDRFVADGGDELALKMMLGGDEAFKSFKEDRALLERVKDSLSGGTPLTKKEIADYDALMQKLDTSRAGITEAELNALRNLDTDNNALLQLLRDREAATHPAVIANYDAVINRRFRGRPEYDEFFAAYDALPKAKGRHREIEKLLATATDDFHAGMFDKKNPHFGKDAG